MAKKIVLPKKKARLRQQRIPGSIDVPTEKILRKAEEYVEILQQRMAAQVDENALRGELIELMKSECLQTFSLDGHTVTLIHSETDKLTIKSVTNDADD